MKRILLLALPLAAAGCEDIHIAFNHDFGGTRTKGNGKPKEESRIVGEYDKVIVGSAFQVEATEGKLGPIKISADSNLLPMIKTEVKDRTLRVWTEGSTSTSSPLKLSLSTPTITGFEASGATKVQLSLKSKHDLDLGASGSSEIKVTGELSNLTCDLSGASKATFSASSLDKLNTVLSGSSALLYSGTVDSVYAQLSGASSITGGMNGNVANVKMSGASKGAFGRFLNVSKELTGASNANFAR